MINNLERNINTLYAMVDRDVLWKKSEDVDMHYLPHRTITGHLLRGDRRELDIVLCQLGSEIERSTFNCIRFRLDRSSLFRWCKLDSSDFWHRVFCKVNQLSNDLSNIAIYSLLENISLDWYMGVNILSNRAVNYYFFSLSPKSSSFVLVHNPFYNDPNCYIHILNHMLYHRSLCQWSGIYSHSIIEYFTSREHIRITRRDPAYISKNFGNMIYIFIESLNKRISSAADKEELKDYMKIVADSQDYIRLVSNASILDYADSPSSLDLVIRQLKYSNSSSLKYAFMSLLFYSNETIYRLIDALERCKTKILYLMQNRLPSVNIYQPVQPLIDEYSYTEESVVMNE